MRFFSTNKKKNQEISKSKDLKFFRINKFFIFIFFEF